MKYFLAISAIRSDTAIAEWQSGYTYAIGDYCLHNGYLYRSITNGSHSEWNDEYFNIVTLEHINSSIVRDYVGNAQDETTFIQGLVNSVQADNDKLYSTGAVWEGHYYYWVAFIVRYDFLMGISVNSSGWVRKIYGPKNAIVVEAV